MYGIPFVAFAIFFALLPVFPCKAQTERLPPGESRTLELVDHLKELIESAERDPRSDPRLIRQLRNLVRRYDWPWRVSLLYDDFHDGNYTSNPTWLVGNGDFWVPRGSGLRSAFDPPADETRSSDRRRENPAVDILEGILWGGKEREGRSARALSPSSSEIYSKVRISNAFAVKLRLRSRAYADRKNRFEIGPYVGDQRDWGYRLAYDSGKNASLSLLRIAPGRSAVIEIYDGKIDLEDGNPHSIEWRRGGDGDMVVLFDNNEIIRTIDRAYEDSFDGLSINNKGGDYEFNQISVFGTSR